MPVPLPAHVWVKAGETETAGLLLRWQWQGAEWWAEVVTVVDGQASVQVVRADLLRLAD